MEKQSKTDPYDIDIQACSTMDCTGLIPAKPKTEEELENYEELYPYLTKAQSHSPKVTSKNPLFLDSKKAGDGNRTHVSSLEG